jgi:signal peptidase
MTSVEAYWASLQGVHVPQPRRPRAGAILGCVATAMLVALALAYGALRLADWRPLTILTASMRPALAPGDMVLVSPQSASTVKGGEVITFANPHVRGRTLTHRVVRVERGGTVPAGWLVITTKGDANPVAERWTIRTTGTVGRLRARLPMVGELAAPLGAGVPRGAAIALLTVVAALAALWGIWRR